MRIDDSIYLGVNRSVGAELCGGVDGKLRMEKLDSVWRLEEFYILLLMEVLVLGLADASVIKNAVILVMNLTKEFNLELGFKLHI